MHSILFRLLPSIAFIPLPLWIPVTWAQSTPRVTIPPQTSDNIQEPIPRSSGSVPSLPEDSPESQVELVQQESTPLPVTNFDSNTPFPVRQITVQGNTVLEEEIAELIAKYEARGELTFEDLLQLRSDITQLYLDNGYITSGAFLPNDQSLTDGIIRVQIVEGTLERIDLCLLSPGAGRNNEDLNDAIPIERSQSTELQPSDGTPQSPIEENQLQQSELEIENQEEQIQPNINAEQNSIEENQSQQSGFLTESQKPEPQRDLWVVSQKRVNGRVGKPSFTFFLSNVYCFSVQMAALFA